MATITVNERSSRGKAARGRVPRSRHAEWEPSTERRSPVELLLEQFAETCAGQNERDHAALDEAVRSGQVAADRGA